MYLWLVTCGACRHALEGPSSGLKVVSELLLVDVLLSSRSTSSKHSSSSFSSLSPPLYPLRLATSKMTASPFDCALRCRIPNQSFFSPGCWRRASLLLFFGTTISQWRSFRAAKWTHGQSSSHRNWIRKCADGTVLPRREESPLSCACAASRERERGREPFVHHHTCSAGFQDQAGCGISCSTCRLRL